MSRIVTDSKRVDELARRVEQLTRLVEVSQAVAAELDLETLLQQIVDAATRLLEADLGGLLVHGEEEAPCQLFKVSGWPGAPASFPTGAGVLRLPCREGASLRLEDVRRHPQAVGFPACHPPVGPFLAVPLQRNRQPLGALFVGKKPGDLPFSSDDEDLLRVFAAQATIAIENARLYARAEALARVEERQRIAQALHDSLAQNLFTIGLQAQGCIDDLAPEGPALRRLQGIRRLAGRAGDELRSAIFALRSPYLPGSNGLLALLEEQIAEFQARSGIAALFIAPPHFPSLPPLLGEAVYRIVCEALSNVRKHARAAAVVVSLHCDAHAVQVTIQDDGVGLAEPLPLDADEYGLRFGVATMRQLAAQAQGHLAIQNGEEQGVMVRARFPPPEACDA